MKKILFLVLIFITVSVSSLHAQQGFTDLYDSTFANISRAKATTGILYDRVIPIVDIRQFSGNNPDTAEMYHFLFGFDDLYHAAFEPNKRLPFDGDSLGALLSNSTAYANVGILHYNFNVIDTLIAQQKLYSDANNILRENTTIAASLYKEATVLLIAPLKEHFAPGNITFRFNSLFHFDNTHNPITQLRVNFGNGSGWQNVGVNSTKKIYYTAGEYVLCFIATYRNGQSDTCYAKVSCTSVQQAGGNCIPHAYQTSKYDNSRIDKFDDTDYPAFTGYNFTDYDGKQGHNKGNVWVYYADNTKKLRKPILIVDGFDPDNPRKHESSSGDKNATTNECAKSIWAVLELLDDPNVHLGEKMIDELGYDLVILDLPSGGDYIERNAMVAIKVIQWINEKLRENGSPHEVVVVGPSMGGQVSRYALAYMEKYESTYGKHNCRLWVSFDSPHQGANIPLGAQAWAYYFRGTVGVKDLWNNKLKCVAAGQLLMHHMDNASHQRFNKYYNLNNHTIGYPEKVSYPVNLRKIAASNGSLHGTKSGNGEERAFQYNPWYIVQMATAKIFLYPEAGQTGDIFDIYHLMPYPPFIIRNYRRVTNTTNKCTPDGAPGCLYNTFFQVKNGHKLVGFGAHVLLDKETHCFMPTISVLDIRGNLNYCTDFSHRDLVAEGLTPFQSYCGPGSAVNMEHITFNKHIANWLLNEIETYTIGSREIKLCEYQNYTVHLPADAAGSATVLWRCSDNLQIISGQGDNTVQVKCMSVDDDTWVEATVSTLTHTGENANIDLSNSKKQLKRYYITVNDHDNSLPELPNSITGDLLLDETYKLTQSIQIENNSSVKISGTVYCSPYAKIVVQPGSKLIIDGGILTNICDGELWKGIEVHGNPDKLQQDLSDQGVLELMNGAVIENAQIGILLGTSTPSKNCGGGIVKANDSKFINCAIGVEFKPYTRISNMQELPNRSCFYNCHFTWEHNMITNQVSILPYTHVKLAGVGRVTFYGCSFRDNRIFSKNITQGIYAHNASVNVVPITSSTGYILEENIIQRSLFENLTYGIYYEKSAPTLVTGISMDVINENIGRYERMPFTYDRNLSVKHSEFIRNVQGIFNTNANNSVIQHNNFKLVSFWVAPEIIKDEFVMGDEAKVLREEDLTQFEMSPVFTEMFGVGININSSTGYLIQGNNFTQDSYDESRGIGIHVKNSGGSPNVIDNNQFDILYVGVLSNGNNKTNYGTDGLQLRCNVFSGECKHAIAVNTPNGICYSQGSQMKPAGNVFSLENRGEGMDIYTPQSLLLKYYYSLDVIDEKPQVVSEDVWVNQANGVVKCGLSTVVTFEDVLLEFELDRLRYASVLYNYVSLIDGGATSQLLTELELSWDKSVWDIRKELLSKSPYLSSDVIIEVAENAILPHAMLLEVCLANPDATRKGDVLQILCDKLFNPMPEYMCDLIVASWEEETFRTHLEASLADAALDMECAARQLINFYLADSEIENCNKLVIDILESLPSIEAAFDIADIYAGMYQFDQACKQIEGLRERKLSENNEEEMNRMLEWYNFLEKYSRSEKRESNLLPEEIDVLLNLAKTNTRVGDLAKSFLYYYSGCSYNYHVEPEFPDFLNARSVKNPNNKQNMLDDLYSKVSVYPNPAAVYTTFSYQLHPDVKNSILQIFDNKGVVVLSVELSGSVGHYLWDTRNLSSGTYMFTIISNDKKLKSGKVVIQK